MERLTKKYETLFRKNVHIKHVITLFQKKLVLNLLCIINPPKNECFSDVVENTPWVVVQVRRIFFSKRGSGNAVNWYPCLMYMYLYIVLVIEMLEVSDLETWQ